MTNRIKAWLRTVFGFSRAESRGFLILIPLLLAILLAGPLYKNYIIRKPTDLTSDRRKLDSLIATLRWDSAVAKEKKTTLFAFDPNTATREELISLGIPGAVAGRIVNFRNKGGQFRKPKDFGKIYSMDSSTFRALKAYLKLPVMAANVKPKNDSTAFAKKVVEKFDLNLADTSLLRSVYGIGKVRAERIVKYRDKLGGFHSEMQIREVYGLDSASISQLLKRSFVDPQFQPKRIQVNSASEKELATHPYLNSKNARAITAYRFQHGKFQAIDDLQKIATLTEETFHKIKPYLSLD